MIKNIIVFSFSYVVYLLRGYTRKEGYHAFRALYGKTNGRLNDVVSSLISLTTSKYINIEPSGILGKLDSTSLDNIVNGIKKDGYFIFDQPLPNDMVAEMTNYAESVALQVLEVSEKENLVGYGTESKYDRDNIVSPKYTATRSTVMKSDVFSKLVFDKSLLAIAQKYLNVKPLVSIIVFWWSVPFGGRGLSEAAQLYHPDMDTIKFLKFFFYLTDVTSKTGPHCLIRGSHKDKPKDCREVRRYSDEELSKVYNKEDFIEILGKKGSIVAVDTRAFHKGKPVEEKERLLFQIEFDNTGFGVDYEKIELDNNAKIKYHDFLYKYGYTFKNMLKK